MELSVVIPIYHTAKQAVRNVPDVISTLRDKYKEFEIIFIIDNDQISDTVQELFPLKEQFPEINIHQLNRNYGQQFATLCGCYLAKGQYILTVDEDMSKYIPQIIIEDYKQTDVFYFFYDKSNMYKSETRKVLTNLFRFYIERIANLKQNSTFRTITSSLRDRFMKSKHIFWNVDAMIFNNTNNIGSITTTRFDLSDHHSAYNYTRLFRLAFEISYEFNTVLMNLLLGIFPAVFFYFITYNTWKSILVYVVFVAITTSFFNFLKYCSVDTEVKILKAIKY